MSFLFFAISGALVKFFAVSMNFVSTRVDCTTHMATLRELWGSAIPVEGLLSGRGMPRDAGYRMTRKACSAWWCHAGRFLDAFVHFGTVIKVCPLRQSKFLVFSTSDFGVITISRYCKPQINDFFQSNKHSESPLPNAYLFIAKIFHNYNFQHTDFSEIIYLIFIVLVF